MIHPKINFPKLLFFKIIVPQFFPENLPKIFPQNLFLQIPLQNRYIKAVIHCQKRFLKPIFQNNSRKKNQKLFPKIIFRKYSPKMLPIQNSCSKLPYKITPQNYF